MFASLTKALGSFAVSAFPYTVGEKWPSAWGGWEHYKGTAHDDNARVSIFKITASSADAPRMVAARNGVKRLTRLRHPNLLAFKSSYETTEKGQAVLYIVTQAVQPLVVVLQELDLQGEHKDAFVAMCVLHMSKAIGFLNNDCNLIHGGICVDAVVVTDTLDPKLHGFDLLSEHALPPPDFPLQQAPGCMPPQYQPAELARAEWDTIRSSPPYAVDAWGLGCLIQEICSHKHMASVETLRHTESIPPLLLAEYQKLLASQPGRRLNPSKLAECKFLHNKLVQVVSFMEDIAVKDAVEKDSFFKRLPAILPHIPPAVAVRKLLPLLSASLEYGGAPAHAVGSLMLIGRELQGEEFNARVVPTLSMLFASQDRALRRSLLESMDQYAPHLTQQVIEDQIFPQLQTGFSDANAYIRELTLKSMLSLAPKMSNKTLTQSVLKHLSKLQVDEEPSIRANTTVLLGNIAPHLGEATCRRVLLNAFSRALKDAFAPARVAGLRAMIATKQYYSAEDAALRIIPSAAPMAMDGDGDVRACALQVIDTFIVVLRMNDKAMKDAAAARAAADPSSGAPPLSSGTLQLSPGNSMLGWAVSGLMSSIGPSAPAPAPYRGVPSPGQQPAAVPAAHTHAHTASAPAAPAPAARAPAPEPRSAAPSRPATAAPTTGSGGGAKGEGWGAGDGWGDDDAPSGGAKAAPRGKAAGASASATATATAAKAQAGPSGGGGAGDGWDNDDDALEDMAPPKPVAAPRPRPAPRSAAAGGAKTGGAMKLGAQKLGAEKRAD
ncbi:hypothetical protein FOA52_005555 [Chlamydomonas sp. UWO 241]|nr:hypothetical protein FOA52_005555 [Chlamydomonas sp. UWO 241]